MIKVAASLKWGIGTVTSYKAKRSINKKTLSRVIMCQMKVYYYRLQKSLYFAPPLKGIQTG